MPILKHKGRIVFFAHVPKCAGTAVSRYLTSLVGPMSFSDTKFLSIPSSDRWSKSSPQHIPASSLERLFVPGFFDESFAVVRHPINRIAAVFLFQKEKEGTVQTGTTFEDWLSSIRHLQGEQPFLYDNHTRPMIDFVPQGAKVFHLEDGLDHMQSWLENILELSDAEKGQTVPRINTRYNRLKGQVPKFEISDEATALIHEIYRQDFERFGYE